MVFNCPKFEVNMLFGISSDVHLFPNVDLMTGI
jgi:hypothetical protein